MRVLLLITVGLTSLVALPRPGAAQAPAGGGGEYLIEGENLDKPELRPRKRPDGTDELWVELRFKVRRVRDRAVVTEVGKDEIFVKDDEKPVRVLEVVQPQPGNLTLVLVMDVSGSMARHNKITEARNAALGFLDQLDAHVDVGLILFDDQVPKKGAPLAEARRREPARSRDLGRLKEHRDEVRRLIKGAKPEGGTAYLDATMEGVRMLQGVPGQKAVVVLTDGVDLSSSVTLRQVVDEAVRSEVRVYTVGIGEKGELVPVTTVLVLDRSGSMLEKAAEDDRRTKIEALKDAASRFVRMMRSSPSPNDPAAQMTLLPFSDTVETAEPFTTDKVALQKRIAGLKAPSGGTRLYDATLDGIETLVAAQPAGKKAVVVFTDGEDESSRRSHEEAIWRAKEVGIPLHMLGLGQIKEPSRRVMEQMAKETGGSYHHADSDRRLLEIFEGLSIALHDDGIDEASLKELARDTKGEYTHVKDAAKLKIAFEKLADRLQWTYSVAFPSVRQRNDGSNRPIDIQIIRGGVMLGQARAQYVVRGVVVPQMSASVYLIFLGALGLLLACPAGLRRLARKNGG
jgi:VWFA-related protein